jgi:hypothetical protein
MSRIKVCVRAKPGPVSPLLALSPESHSVRIETATGPQLLSFDKVFDSSYKQEELYFEVGGETLVAQLLESTSACVCKGVTSCLRPDRRRQDLHARGRPG